MLTGSPAADQFHVQIIYAKDLIGARQVVDNWIDKAGSAIKAQDIQFVSGNPAIAMIVYLKPAWR